MVLDKENWCLNPLGEKIKPVEPVPQVDQHFVGARMRNLALDGRACEVVW
jgi:hypothetical protein